MKDLLTTFHNQVRIWFQSWTVMKQESNTCLMSTLPTF